MTSIASISLSGMQAAQNQLDAAAGNIANADTPGYQRRAVLQSAQPGGGVSSSTTETGQTGASLTTDIVSELQAKNSFLANLAVFKTSSKLTGVLLDQKA